MRVECVAQPCQRTPGFFPQLAAALIDDVPLMGKSTAVLFYAPNACISHADVISSCLIIARTNGCR